MQGNVSRPRSGGALKISLLVVGAHLLVFAVWFALNSGWMPVHLFDPSPYPLLRRCFSLEALGAGVAILWLHHRRLWTLRTLSSRRHDLLAQYEAERIRRFIEAVARRIGVDDERN